MSDSWNDYIPSNREEKNKEENLMFDLTDFRHLFVHRVEEGKILEEDILNLSKKVSSLSLKDLYPSFTLYQMVSDAKDRIDAEYHGCSSEKARHGDDFLSNLLKKLHTFSPKVHVLLKAVVSDLSRHHLV